MSHNSEPGKCVILRLRILEGSLMRNIAKFGSMSPFVEFYWNNQKRKTKISSNSHLSPVWEECYIFESTDVAQLQFKVYHSSLLFTSQEVGSGTISIDELIKGKIKEWVYLYNEGTIAGKLLISATMYEERRSEQSTHNTSYATVDLKEEYTRKVNELELEKEELEFFKRKYKRKAEKFNREKRVYQQKISEIVRRTTPKHTEESSSEEIYDFTEPGTVKITMSDEVSLEEIGFKKEKAQLQKEKIMLVQLKDQVEIDLARLRREKNKHSVHNKLIRHSHEKLNEILVDNPDGKKLRVTKSTTEEKLSMFSSKILNDWQETENMKNNLKANNRKSNELELKFDMEVKMNSPKRAVTPKCHDIDSFKMRVANYSAGKLVFNDS